MNDAYERMNSLYGVSTDPRGKIVSYLERPIGLALIIVAALGITGILSPAVAGFSIAGLAGGKYLISLIGRDFKKGKNALTLSTMMTTAIVVLGILGGLGILSSSIACWIAIIPNAIVLGAIALLLCCCCPCICCVGLAAAGASAAGASATGD